MRLETRVSLHRASDRVTKSGGRRRELRGGFCAPRDMGVSTPVDRLRRSPLCSVMMSLDRWSSDDRLPSSVAAGAIGRPAALSSPVDSAQ